MMLMLPHHLYKCLGECAKAFRAKLRFKCLAKRHRTALAICVGYITYASNRRRPQGDACIHRAYTTSPQLDCHDAAPCGPKGPLGAHAVSLGAV